MKTKWFKSKAFWGSAVTIVASVATVFGVTLSPEMQAELANVITTLVDIITTLVE